MKYIHLKIKEEKDDIHNGMNKMVGCRLAPYIWEEVTEKTWSTMWDMPQPIYFTILTHYTKTTNETM